MSIGEIVKKEIKKVENYLFTPKKQKDMVKYLKDVELSNYFKNIDDKTKQDRYNLLEQKINEKFEENKKYLGNLDEKISNLGNKGTVLSDVYRYFITDNPIATEPYFILRTIGLGIKSIPEAKNLYQYVKETHDFGAIAKWLAYKPIEISLPLIGPMITHDAVSKLVRQRIIREAKKEFVKEVGGEWKEHPLYDLDKFAEKKTGYQIKPAMNYA